MKKRSAKETKVEARKPRLDERTPVGTSLTREYKGRTYEVLVTEAGFELDGTTHLSLTAAAKAITGPAPISGHAFFGLWKPKGRGAAAEEPTGGAQLAQDAPKAEEAAKAPKKAKKRKGAKKAAK